MLEVRDPTSFKLRLLEAEQQHALVVGEEKEGRLYLSGGEDFVEVPQKQVHAVVEQRQQ